MGQQIPRFGGEGSGHHAQGRHLLIAGLVMLQSVAAFALRFHQEVVARIVMRAEQRSGFGYEVAESGDSLRRHVETFGRFLKDIQQMTLRNPFGRDVELAHDGATHQGRIDQRGERAQDRSECCHPAATDAATR